MTTRFGYGYERRSKDNASTQHARSHFLGTLSKLRDDVIVSLFDLGYKSFSEFLLKHNAEIDGICGSIGSPQIAREQGVRMFVNSWLGLHIQPTANLLCLALRDWGNRWNLTNDWCLNHAVLTLRDQSWEGALYWLDTEPIMTQFLVTDDLKKRGVATFVFRYSNVCIEVEGSFSKSLAQFKEEIEERFKALGGPAIRGARKALEFQLAEYRNRVARARKVLNLEAPAVRWAEDHFNWLIKYQLPPCMKYREIARELGRDEKTIREGIKDVASLMGLTLRSSERDRHSGRPKGVRETRPRRREQTGMNPL